MKYLHPHKLKPLNQDILVISIYILNYLKNTPIKEEKLSVILSHIRKKLNSTEKTFLYGLNFLYMFKKIDYNKNDDKVILLWNL